MTISIPFNKAWTGALALIALLATPNVGWADPECRLIFNPDPPPNLRWGTVGSGGVVDEADISRYRFYGGVAGLRDGKQGTVDVRYNIPQPHAEPSGDPDLHKYCLGSLVMRFRDNGASARVLIILKEYNIATGAVRNVLRLNTNQVSSPSDSFQTARWCVHDDPRLLNFRENTYYLHAFIRKTAGDGRPELGLMVLNENGFHPDIEEVVGFGFRCSQ